MMLVSGLVMLALLGRVEPFKFSKPSQGESQSESYYRAPLFLPPGRLYPAQAYYQAQPLAPAQPLIKQEATKGAPLALAPAPAPAPFIREPLAAPLAPAPQPLAYVIVRAVQVPQYQYLRPLRYQPAAYYPAPAPQPIQPAPATKGGEAWRQVEQLREEGSEQGVDFAAIQQDKKSKFAKLKSQLEQFAASAKSKLSLGSSYQVVSEEIVVPQPQQLLQQAPALPAPIQQEKIQQEKIQQEPIQQEQVRETVQQQQQQQEEEQLSSQQLEEEPRAVQAIKEAPKVQAVKEAPRLQAPLETKARKEPARLQPSQQQQQQQQQAQVAQSSATF